VQVVVADTGPLHYLVLIGEVDCLPRLFETVLVPEMVRDELSRARTPPSVRAWMASPPAWLQIMPSPHLETLLLPELDAGERAAIALATSLPANLLLIDDRRGSAAAIAQGLETTGTLGLLDRAARHGLIDLAASLGRLKATNFRYRPEMLDALLAQHRERSRGS
jgi:predicted nucleic acid-binding protein